MLFTTKIGIKITSALYQVSKKTPLKNILVTISPLRGVLYRSFTKSPSIITLSQTFAGVAAVKWIWTSIVIDANSTILQIFFAFIFHNIEYTVIIIRQQMSVDSFNSVQHQGQDRIIKYGEYKYVDEFFMIENFKYMFFISLPDLANTEQEKKNIIRITKLRVCILKIILMVLPSKLSSIN